MPLGTPTLTPYSCENLSTRTNSELPITKKGQNKVKYTIRNSTRICEGD